ncbi:MAG: DUF433 domain-containing protein [Limisphaerales bacterium]
MKRKIVAVDLEVMGGTPCFAGTRVPVLKPGALVEIRP